ncbi:MAG: hypothetical protein FWE30_05390 [Bacteroidales bacterium]|nr:hypothetical protein [Bacteroidales bacterium]
MSLFVTGINLCNAQQRTVERIHMATDRALYVAGESIWLSLYCFDMSGQSLHFSQVSSVAYVELRNEAALVAGVKLRVQAGRGSGKLQIPPTLPTGNYRLIAYTKQMLNEDKPSFFDKIIPVYNTLSTDRISPSAPVEDKPLPNTSSQPFAVISPHIDLQWEGDKNSVPINGVNTISLKNTSNEAMTLSVSIARTDVPPAQGHTLRDFLAHTPNPAEIKFEQKYIPEYEGEIIRGRITNQDVVLSEHQSVFLSAVNGDLNLYASSIDARTGAFAFFTHSLYGNREIVLECPAVPEASFELFDSFVKPPVAPVPALYIDKEYESFLVQRSVEMQVSHRFGIDTLFDQTVVLDNPLLHNAKPVVYALDNYTRFPIMQDVMVEFVTELRFRTINNRLFLQVLLETHSGWSFSEQNTLVVIDGIAIFDHERLLRYDPLKVKTISIYPTSYYIGGHIFDGIAKFDTYTGNYPGLSLGRNALILDFEGAQYPCRFTGKAMTEGAEHLPDIRSLLYWDPQVDVPAGENHEILMRTSSVPGKYAIVLEGITSGGQPVYHRAEFRVE